MTSNLQNITAKLRNEFLPLLQTLEKENTFISYTYIIELLFSLVRFDASLRVEERDVFLRAFNFLATAQLRKLKETTEQYECMTRVKQRLQKLRVRSEALRITSQHKMYEIESTQDDNNNIKSNTSISVNDTTLPFIEDTNERAFQQENNTILPHTLELENESRTNYVNTAEEIRLRLQYYFDKYFVDVTASQPVTEASSFPPETLISSSTSPSFAKVANNYSLYEDEELQVNTFHESNIKCDSKEQKQTNEQSKKRKEDQFNYFVNAFWIFIANESYESIFSNDIRNNNADTTINRNNNKTKMCRCTDVDVWVLLALFNCNNVKQFSEAIQRAARYKNYSFTSLDSRQALSANSSLLNSSNVGYMDSVSMTPGRNNPQYALHYAKTVPNLLALKQIDHKQWIKSARLAHELVTSTMHLPLEVLHDEFWSTAQIFILVILEYLLELELPSNTKAINTIREQQSKYAHKELEEQHMEHEEEQENQWCWSDKELLMFKIISPSLCSYTTSAANYVTLATPILATHSSRNLASYNANYATAQSSQIPTAEVTPNLSITSVSLSTNANNNNNSNSNSNNNTSVSDIVEKSSNAPIPEATSAESISSSSSLVPLFPVHDSSIEPQVSVQSLSLSPVRIADELKRLQECSTISSKVPISTLDVILHVILSSLLCNVQRHNIINESNDESSNGNNKSKLENTKGIQETSSSLNVPINKSLSNMQGKSPVDTTLPSLLPTADTQEEINQISTTAAPTELLTIPVHQASNISSRLTSTSNMANLSGLELQGSGITNYSFNSTCTYVTNYNNNNNNNNSITNNTNNVHSNTPDTSCASNTLEMQLAIKEICYVYKDILDPIMERWHEEELEKYEEEEQYEEAVPFHKKRKPHLTISTSKDNLTQHKQMKSNTKTASIASYLCRVINEELYQVQNSLVSLEQVTTQTRCEIVLLTFRVVSSLLDWVIPAAYGADGRLSMFYRKWVCDCYRLLYEERLLEQFEKLLDQNVEKTANSEFMIDDNYYKHNGNSENRCNNNNNHHQQQQQQRLEQVSEQVEAVTEHNHHYKELQKENEESHQAINEKSLELLKSKTENNINNIDITKYSYNERKDKADPISFSIPHSPTLSVYSYTSNTLFDSLALVVPGCGVEIICPTRVPRYSSHEVLHSNASSCSAVGYTATMTDYSKKGNAYNNSVFPQYPSYASLSSPACDVTASHNHLHRNHNEFHQHNRSSKHDEYEYHHSISNNANNYCYSSYYYAGNNFPLHVGCTLLDQGTQVYSPRHFLLTRFITACIRNINKDAIRSLLRIFDAPEQSPYYHYYHQHWHNQHPHEHPLQHVSSSSSRNSNNSINNNHSNEYMDTRSTNRQEHKKGTNRCSSSSLHNTSQEHIPRIASRVYVSNTILSTASSLSAAASSPIAFHTTANSFPSSPTHNTEAREQVNHVRSPISVHHASHSTAFNTIHTEYKQRHLLPHQHEQEHSFANQSEIWRGYSQYMPFPQGPSVSNTHLDRSVNFTHAGIATFTNNKNNNNNLIASPASFQSSGSPYNIYSNHHFPTATSESEYRPYELSHQLQQRRHYSPLSKSTVTSSFITKDHNDNNNTNTINSNNNNNNNDVNSHAGDNATHIAMPELIHSPITLLQEGGTEQPVLLHHHRFRYPVVNSISDLIALYTHTLDDATLLLSPHDPIRASLVLNTLDCTLHNCNNITVSSSNNNNNNNNNNINNNSNTTHTIRKTNVDNTNAIELMRGVELLSNYLDDVCEECVDESIEITTSLPAMLLKGTSLITNNNTNDASEKMSKKKTKSNKMQNVNLTQSEEPEEESELDNNGKEQVASLLESSSGSTLNQRANGVVSPNANSKESNKKQGNAKIVSNMNINIDIDNDNEGSLTGNNSNLMMTVPLNIPSWNSEHDKQEFTLIIAKLQRMYKTLSES